MVNGQNFSGTGYQLDGTENRDPILGIIVINPNLEAIGEAKITSQNYDAEFGQATAGVVSVQTKSGTEQVLRQRVRVLPEQRAPGAEPVHAADPQGSPGEHRNQFGFSVGGRSCRTGCSSSATIRARAAREGGSRLLSVPTRRSANRQSQRLRRDHLRPESSANPAPRTQFAGGIIPGGQLSPQALNILDLIPQPNLPGKDNGTRDNFSGRPRRRSTPTQFDGRDRPPARASRPTSSVAIATASSSATARRRSGRAAARSWSAWAASRT